MKLSVFVACIVAVFSVCGCDQGPELAGVRGMLRYKGTPVPNATIIFNTTGIPPAIAVTDSSGAYQVVTPHVGEGIPPGTYRITIMALQETGAVPKSMMDEVNVKPDPVKIKWLVPSHYADLAKTPLEREVQSGDNIIDFDLPE